VILNIPSGTQAAQQFTVTAENLAVNWHSGAAQVLATPQMVGWMEVAAVAAVDHLLPAGFCTVGTVINVRHLAPTPLNAVVTVSATLVSQVEKQLTFEVVARDEIGVIGQGTHQRYIVNLDRFEARARARGQETP